MNATDVGQFFHSDMGAPVVRRPKRLFMAQLRQLRLRNVNAAR